MTTEEKAVWNDMIVTILDVEHKGSLGDLLRIKIDSTGELRIVNSQYIKRIKYI